jgi:GntR family transcriptional regulator, transcriptional repressor for pyruvate dehydrogenase complex
MSELKTEPAESPAPAPKAAALVAAHIRKQIVMGELAEGDLLPPEAEMLEKLSVSRPTLRQAFRILEAEHLITVQRGSRGGTTVHRPSARLASRYLGDLLRFRNVTLGDVHEAKFMIEPAAVAELARNHDDTAIGDLRELLEAQGAATTDAEMRRAADKFHVRVMELAGNSTLAEYAKLVHYLIRGHIRRYESMRRQDHDLPLGHGESAAHERLIELIEAGASHAASQHWRQHLVAVRDQLADRCPMDSPLDEPE